MKSITVVIALVIAACSSPSEPAQTLRSLHGVPRTESVATEQTALVLVDFQEEFFSGTLPLPGRIGALDHAIRLLEWARREHILVVHVRNVTRPGAPLFAPDSPTSRFVAPLTPRAGELVITKTSGGAFTRTELEPQLRAHGIDTVVIAGLMTHLAVAMSAQDAAVLGYRVIVAADATATRALPAPAASHIVSDRQLQESALAALADHVADVMPTVEVITLRLDPHTTDDRARQPHDSYMSAVIHL